MARRTVTVNLSDAQAAWVERTGNRSEYVRRLIDADMAAHATPEAQEQPVAQRRPQPIVWRLPPAAVGAAAPYSRMRERAAPMPSGVQEPKSDGDLDRQDDPGQGHQGGSERYHGQHLGA